MKKNFFALFLCLACLFIILVNGCKKDTSAIPPPPPTHIGTETSFTEEFDSVLNLPAKGWVLLDNSDLGSNLSAPWGQGFYGYDKGGNWSGFYAYSYTNSPDEFAYSGVPYNTNNYSVSSWLLSPVLSVKNGDKISFYTRADSTAIYTERIQVLMNKSTSTNVGAHSSTVGDFKTTLLEINSLQVAGGYPVLWTKYEYTFSDISGKMDTRIGFRHCVTNTTNAKGIGIDLFSFQAN